MAEDTIEVSVQQCPHSLDPEFPDGEIYTWSLWESNQKRQEVLLLMVCFDCHIEWLREKKELMRRSKNNEEFMDA